MNKSPTRLNIDGEIEKRCGKCGEWWPATVEYFCSHISKTSSRRLIASPCLACKREAKHCPPVNPTKWTREKVIQLHNEYEAGATLKALGDKYGYCAQQISALFKTHNLKTRRNGSGGKRFGGHAARFTEIDVRKWYIEYELGASCMMIGKKYGLTDVMVGRYFRKYGLKIRSFKDAATVLLKRLKDENREHPWGQRFIK